MTILQTGDFHLGKNNDTMLGENGRFAKTNEIVDCIRETIKCFKESDVDLYLQTGDWFDKSRIDNLYKEIAIELLNELDAIGKPTFIVQGNHENSDFKSGSMHPLAKIKFKNIKFFLYPDIYEIENIRFLILPHISKSFLIKNNETLDSFVIKWLEQNCNESMTNILVTHSVIPGATAGSEQYLLSGGVQEIKKFSGKLHAIMSGHIHKEQYFEIDTIPVFYAGSICYLNIDERKEKKCFYIVDTKDFTYEKNYFENLKKYKVVTIKFGDKCIARIDEEKIKEMCKDKIIRFDVYCRRENKLHLNLKDIVNTASETAFKIMKPKYEYYEEEKIEITTKETNKLSIKDLFIKCSENHEDQIKTTGMSIIEEELTKYEN